MQCNPEHNTVILPLFLHHSTEEQQRYDCPDCQEVFKSKVGLRRHQTYACKYSPSASSSSSSAVAGLDASGGYYSNMNEQLMLQQHQQQQLNGTNNNSTSIPGEPLMPVRDHSDGGELTYCWIFSILGLSVSQFFLF